MGVSSEVPFEYANGLLSRREREVLFQLARGLANKEIARQMGLSTRTVDRHIASVFTKMRVNSRTQAVLKALRQDMISLHDIADIP